MFQKTPLILQFKLFYGYKTKHPIHQNNGTSHEMPLFLFYMLFLFYSKWFCTLLVLTTHNTPKPSCEGFSIMHSVIPYALRHSDNFIVVLSVAKNPVKSKSRRSERSEEPS